MRSVQQPLSNVGRLHEYPGVKPETAEEVDRAEGAHKVCCVRVVAFVVDLKSNMTRRTRWRCCLSG